MDQRSALLVYAVSLFINNSGAIVIGVPNLVLVDSTPYLANPKSPIITQSSYKNMFANLTSLCMILFFNSSLNPFMIYIRKYTASFSDK